MNIPRKAAIIAVIALMAFIAFFWLNNSVLSWS